ncbi:MAG: carbonic anhydrase family protein [Phycisphaerales bacterium]|nr:carbonic anhydrase family protein [Phycisphaerales bacterium]
MKKRQSLWVWGAFFVFVVGCEVVDFGYFGEIGPTAWSELMADYVACGDGTEQSPVNITTADVQVDGALPVVQTNYETVDAVLINNGHTLEVEYAEGSTLTFGNKTYELVQFHFHTLSEHRVDGAPADMEAHLVHRNDAGELLVLGILIHVGAENAFLAQFWNEFSLSESTTETDIEINVTDLLPADLDYYTYSGSLTTPPCTEIVTWVVLKTPIALSREQVDFFTYRVGNNARPMQELNGRTVLSPN